MKTIKESSYFILGMGNIGKILVTRLLEVGVPKKHILINDVDTSLWILSLPNLKSKRLTWQIPKLEKQM